MTSLPTLMSALTIIFCLAVLVQAFRLDRRLKAVQTVEHSRMVEALDTASDRAEEVTRKLRDLLRSEAAGLQGELTKGRELADELVIMVGVADAAAERLANMKDSGAAQEHADVDADSGSHSVTNDPAVEETARKAKPETDFKVHATAKAKMVSEKEAKTKSAVPTKPKVRKSSPAKRVSSPKHFPRRRVDLKALKTGAELAAC